MLQENPEKGCFVLTSTISHVVGYHIKHCQVQNLDRDLNNLLPDIKKKKSI